MTPLPRSHLHFTSFTAYALAMNCIVWKLWSVGIMSLNSVSGSVDEIFGNSVMMIYVTVYDRRNSRAGFVLCDGM